MVGKEFSKANVLKLIDLVRRKSCLWDPTEPGYHQRKTTRAEWKNVASEMGTTVEGAKLKWRGLRDTFRKEMFKNAKNARRGQESSWIYYQQMKFVTNHCRKSKCVKRNKNELNYQAVKEEEFVHEYQDSVDSVRSSPIVFEICEPAEQQPKAAPRHESVVPVNAFPSESPARAPYEPEQTVQSLQINSSTLISEEADYYFLMSLLPYLRKVPTNRKMLVRTKLQQVFCDEEARS